MRWATRSRWWWLFVLFNRCIECGRKRDHHLHSSACSDDRDDRWCKGRWHHWFGEIV